MKDEMTEAILGALPSRAGVGNVSAGPDGGSPKGVSNSECDSLQRPIESK